MAERNKKYGKYAVDGHEEAHYTVVQTEQETVSGFLFGYSKEDIELISWEDVDFEAGVDTLKKDKSARKVTIIPRDRIISLNIYSKTFEEFQ